MEAVMHAASDTFRATQRASAASVAKMDGPDASFVMIHIGAVLVAVPVQDVVQGVAWPERMDLLPRRASAACGVFDYADQPVAMLDLALWVDLGGDSTAPAAADTAKAATATAAAARKQRYPRALIVRSGGHMVAIGADAVHGMQKIAQAAITRISHDDNSEEIFHSVARGPQIDGVANLLDVQRLMALARTWSGDAGVATERSDAAAVARALQRQFGVVAGEDCSIGFPVADLVEVLPAPALTPFQSPLTEGVCIWRGRHVPVTSIAKCFPHLATAGITRSAPLLALFERDGLALGVLLDEVPVIRAFDQPEQSEQREQLDVCAIADSNGTLVHLVGLDALYARFPERLLSREVAQAENASRSAGTSRDNSNASSHIVFEADGVASTPIEGIEAVLSLPALAPGATHIAWRGAALPLHDLRARTGDKGAVIVVQGKQAPLGFIVDAVQALVQPRAGRLSRLSMPGRGMVDLLTTASATGGQTTYSTRDLAQMARALS